jgi:hypothetical protein
VRRAGGRAPEDRRDPGELINRSGTGQAARCSTPAKRITADEETTMADNDDAAAVERTAKRIFALQNPGKPWPGDAAAKVDDKPRAGTLAKKDRGSGEG